MILALALDFVRIDDLKHPIWRTMRENITPDGLMKIV